MVCVPRHVPRPGALVSTHHEGVLDRDIMGVIAPEREWPTCAKSGNTGVPVSQVLLRAPGIRSPERYAPAASGWAPKVEPTGEAGA